MENHQGEKLRAYVRKLKIEKKTKASEVARLMDITPEWLSTCFNQSVLSAEIRDKAIKGLGLPLDFFEDTPGTPVQKTRQEEVEMLREQARAALADLLEMKEKYLRLLEKYTEVVEKRE